MLNPPVIRLCDASLLNKLSLIGSTLSELALEETSFSKQTIFFSKSTKQRKDYFYDQYAYCVSQGNDQYNLEETVDKDDPKSNFK